MAVGCILPKPEVQFFLFGLAACQRGCVRFRPFRAGRFSHMGRARFAMCFRRSGWGRTGKQ